MGLVFYEWQRSELTYCLHQRAKGMKVFKVLQILRLVHDVNHSFYIVLIKQVSRGAYIRNETTDRALNVFADLVLEGWGSRQRTDSLVYFQNNSQSRLGQMT